MLIRASIRRCSPTFPQANGDTQTTVYDAENRPLEIDAVTAGQATHSSLRYDAAGNLGLNATYGAKYGFDEVSYRDVRYLEQSKAVVNGWTKGKHGIGTGKLVGGTGFGYDVNGKLTVLDRGIDYQERKVLYARYAYNNDGQILTRADYPGGATDLNFFITYNITTTPTSAPAPCGKGVIKPPWWLVAA